MKTTAFLRICLVLVLTVSIAAVHARAGLADLVKYNNEMIPEVNLKEVVIVADKIVPVKSMICETVTYEGEIIPSVQLSEVTITPENNQTGSVRPQAPATKGIRVPVVMVDGQYIASVEGPEIEITAERPSTSLQKSEYSSADEPMISKVNLRNAYDKVTGFLYERGKDIIRKFVPGIF